MLIRAITLQNFGLFHGRNRIDLTPRVKYKRERPVVLIGGRNGSGKTTILEALRLCLYGPLALGERTGQREYESYLRDRIHRQQTTILPHFASVGVEFDYAIGGRSSVYKVQREWELKSRGVECELTITRDGQPLDELDRAHADEFLRDLIPPGVSQLYFFDGEKIQQLAESEDDSGTLGEAIRGLLGMDVVDQLIGDLKVYSRRLETSDRGDPAKQRLIETLQQIEAAETNRRNLTRAQDERQSHVDSLKQRAARIQQRIVREGGAFAHQQESLKAEREQLLRQIHEAESSVRELCGELLPFAFASKLTQSVSEQLAAEECVQNWRTHQEMLTRRIKEMKDGLGDTLFAKGTRVSPNDRQKILRRVGKILTEMLADPEDLPQVELIHRLSTDASARLQHAIQESTKPLQSQLSKTHETIEESTRRLTQIENQLEKLPTDDQLQPILEELSAVHRQQADAERDLARCTEAVEEEDNCLAALRRQQQKLETEIDTTRAGLSRNELASRVQTVLREYSDALALAKSTELTEAVSRRFMQLWQKQNVIKNVAVDPVTYQVTLYDKAGRSITKRELSAGEKQIYAVAMLWSLAEVSGRPLPMVIDTPLGRLDSNHRTHLVEHYFPNASHQVIVLSTDTEIDEEYFAELSPAISHSYRLRFDEKEVRTVVEEGYFWGRRTNKELAHAHQ